MRRLLSVGDGTRTYYHRNQDKTVSIETQQDLAPSKEAIQGRRNDPDAYGQQFQKDGLMHAAHVPAVMQLKMRRKYGVEVWNKHHHKEVMRILRNDPDFAGCIVEPKCFKKTDLGVGMIQRRGVWQPRS